MQKKFPIDAAAAPGRAPDSAEIARLLFNKAVEYLDAPRMETGLKVESSELRTLQLGLLDNFRGAFT